MALTQATFDLAPLGVPLVRPLDVLISCEFSGTVRRAIEARGHRVVSCDLLPSLDHAPNHVVGDVRLLLPRRWDMVLAFPPCTYLCGSGLHWNTRRPGRAALTEAALDFVRLHLEADAPLIALENPVGCISSRIRKPDQIIQPHQFGHDASKTTCLWLKGLPRLVPTHAVPPRLVAGRPRWANQTDSGQNRLGPSEDRWALRALTYPGIAEAMAAQWTPVMECTMNEERG